MFESVRTTLQDPVVRQAIWSGAVVILVLLFLLTVRRILRSIKMDPDRRILISRWFRVAALSMGAFFLFRIWALEMVQDLLDPTIFQKIVISLVGLLIFGLIVTIVRRLIAYGKMDEERRHLFMKWSTYAFIFLYAFLFFRTWTQSDLTEFFQNAILDKLFRSAFAMGVVYLALFFIRRLINSMKVEITKRHAYRKRASYITALVYVIILISIWAGSSQQWTTILSVMGAGIALALHDVLLNIAGWFYIIIRRPYKDGDRIELGGVRGDVIDIRLFETSLLEIGNWVDGDQSTGRVVHMPHGQIFKNPLHNYTGGFEYLWNEFSILITFESNWQRAREILLRCGEEESHEVQEDVQKKINKMAREYLIYYRQFSPIVYTKIEDSGVKVSLRYLTDAKKRRGGEDTISQKILTAVHAEPDIEFAYPTYRIYKRGKEE